LNSDVEIHTETIVKIYIYFEEAIEFQKITMPLKINQEYMTFLQAEQEKEVKKAEQEKEVKKEEAAKAERKQDE